MNAAHHHIKAKPKKRQNISYSSRPLLSSYSSLMYFSSNAPCTSKGQIPWTEYQDQIPTLIYLYIPNLASTSIPSRKTAEIQKKTSPHLPSPYPTQQHHTKPHPYSTSSNKQNIMLYEPSFGEVRADPYNRRLRIKIWAIRLGTGQGARELGTMDGKRRWNIVRLMPEGIGWGRAAMFGWVYTPYLNIVYA